MPDVSIRVDDASMARVMAKLRNLDRQGSAALRVTSTQIAGEVAAQVNLAFMAGGAPQAHRFGSSAKAKRDRIPTVRIGGRQSEGGFTDGMAVLRAVNYGSRLRRFHTPPNGDGVIIQPVIRRMGPVAFKKWEAAVDRLVAAFNRGGVGG